jgi:hypothetical protein
VHKFVEIYGCTKYIQIPSSMKIFVAVKVIDHEQDIELYIQVAENAGQPVLMENLYSEQCFQISMKNQF